VTNVQAQKSTFLITAVIKVLQHRSKANFFLFKYFCPLICCRNSSPNVKSSNDNKSKMQRSTMLVGGKF